MSRLGSAATKDGLTRRQTFARIGALATGAPATAAVRGAPSAVPKGSVLGTDPNLHLLRRASYGVTPDSLARIRQQGADAWLDDQLHPDRLDDSVITRLLTLYPLQTATDAALLALTDDASRRSASTGMIEMTIARQIWSTRQLFEIMVDFWSNHLNVHAPESVTYVTKPIEDRGVIRANALGRFEDMLVADARSPAMLTYLANDKSEKEEPNENYGREIMELHSVGVAAGFTEDDVSASSKMLTGRASDRDGKFLYQADWHAVGPLTIMGFHSANPTAAGGLAAGDSYLRYLARHPSTAAALSRKLAIRFVSDAPPQSLIDMLASVYLDNATAIVPWLQALFGSAEFAASIGQKTRRPQEDLVASIRVMAMSAPASSTKAITTLVSQSKLLDHTPFGWTPPTGYPDVAASWWSVSGTVNSCNLHRSVTRGWPPGLVRPPVANLIAGPAMPTMGDMVARLSVSLLGQTMRSDHAAALLTYAEMTPAQPYDQQEVDKWLPSLCEMVLNSPYHLLR